MNKGYGFRPSEEELIGYLRNRTLLGSDYLVQDITDLGVDICKWEPRDLPGAHPNSQSKKINTVIGKRKPINRATNDGQWKVSGERLKVRASKPKEEIGIKTRLYFYTGEVNEENNKNSKAKDQNCYQNKTPWVLYEYELIGVDPSQNKYFLGKLMMKQSEPTNISSSKGETSQQLPSNYLGNDHIPAPEVQLDFNQEPLVEMEVSNDYYDEIQNQTSISEQANDQFVNPYPEEVFCEVPHPTCELLSTLTRNSHGFVPQKDVGLGRYSIANAENEVVSNLGPSKLQNYVADYATPQVRTVFVENFINRLLKLMIISISKPMYCFFVYVSESAGRLFNLITEPEVPDICFGAENQLYANLHDHPFQNSVPIDNDETERSNQHNIVAENEGFDLPYNFDNNPIADISQMNWFEFDDLYQGDGLYLHELFGVPEAPDNNSDGVKNQSNINQQVAEDQFIPPGDSNSDVVRNQSNINQPVADDQFKPPDGSNCDGVQNQSSINQQDDDQFKNSNFIDNEIGYPDERNKSAAAEIEGSNLPSLGMTESSYPMESFRKRSGMELEGSTSSIDIETEVAQAQAKKSRF
ncbi:hypothetical protein REPUB_Repub15cG0124300 [Reevesia pubescens]